MLSPFDGIGGGSFNPKIDGFDSIGSSFRNSLNDFGGGGGPSMDASFFDASYGGSGSSWGPDVSSPIGNTMNNFYDSVSVSSLWGDSTGVGAGLNPKTDKTVEAGVLPQVADMKNTFTEFNAGENLNDMLNRLLGMNNFAADWWGTSQKT